MSIYLVLARKNGKPDTTFEQLFKATDGFRESITILNKDIDQSMLNPYGEYVLKFAETHGLTIEDAYAHPMVKARLEVFNATGR